MPVLLIRQARFVKKIYRRKPVSQRSTHYRGIAVSTGIKLPGDQWVLISGTLGDLAEVQVFHGGHLEVIEGALLNRDIEMLSSAGNVPLIESHQGGDISQHAGR